MEQRIVEDPVLRQRLSFQRTTDEEGEVLHVEVWVDPGGGVPPHVHPAMEERFDVLAGRPSFLAGKQWQTADPGETVVVPPGTRHAYKNTGNEHRRPGPRRPRGRPRVRGAGLRRTAR